ncbi:MAG: hypothetical protein HKN21_16810 [Candidatus Eisenbacteria bacterium]|uniref:Polysaccharide chain length determinant N-terminal domain-containing protein n=1 Tax=Eiseniibacteriota bacterium TaxID=2212470 RepID=A0A7Y2EEK5_UNCEI|nr:hypothetical protein [Candidatus Eisenbacteria bacterium]
MSDYPKPLDLEPQETVPDVLSLGGILRVLRRWRAIFLTLALGLPLITAIYVLTLPNQYTAKGTILVEMPKGGLQTEMLGQLGAFAGLPTGAPTADIYLSILRSERVAEAVADSLNLTAHYEIEKGTAAEIAEATRLKLKKRVKFDQPDFVTIHILGTDQDPAMSASIVNSYLNQLDAANQTLSVTRAKRTRQLIEEALLETETELAQTRAKMREFQETHGLIALDEQVAATLDLIGTLQGRMLETTAQRDALTGFRRSNSAELQNLNLRIAAFQKQIDTLSGKVAPEEPGDGEKVSDDYTLRLGSVPELAGDYASLLTDLQVQEAKYGVLATRLEQTKIDESQSLPAFEVLDRARVPTRKSGPFRKAFVLVALLAGILGGAVLALLLEELSRRFGPDERRELRGLLPGFVGNMILGKATDGRS